MRINEDNRIDNKQTVNMRYEFMAKQLARISVFLQSYSVPFFIVTESSHRKYLRSIYNF